MTRLNRLLERQIRRAFGDVAALPVEIMPLLERISRSYDHYESDRQLIERTLDLSSNELMGATSQIRAEAMRLAESQELFQLAAESTSDLIYEWFPSTDRIAWFGNIEGILQYEPGTFPNTTQAWVHHVHPEDRAELLQRIDECLAGQPRFSFEYRVITNGGGLRYWRDNGRISFNSDGSVRRFVGAVTDVTSEKDYAARLRDSEQKFRHVAESLGEGLLITDLRDRISFANTRILEMTGYSREELIGRKAYQILVPPSEWSRIESRLRDRVDGKPEQYEIELLCKNGDRIWCLTNATPFRSSTGEIVGTLGALTDITPLKQEQEALRASQSNLSALIENTIDCIWSVDKYLRLITFNTAMAEKLQELFGIIPYVTMPFHERHQGDFAPRWKEWYERTLRGERFVEVLEYTIQSRTYAMQFSFNPILSADGIDGVAVFGKEVTEQRLFQRQLLDAKESAEEMSRLKSSFLANMSHEIRTPMTAILGYAEHLSDVATDSETKRTASIISRSGERLLQTINGILDLARIESNRVEVEIVALDVVPEVTRVLDLLRPLAQRKGLELMLESSDNTLALADTHCLNQILTNIIGNAIKFTEKGHVRVTVCPLEDNRLAIDVTDTGIGIAHEFISHVFEEFKQESTGYGRSHEGTGLGLTISRSLAASIGGELSLVDTEKNRGTTFRLSLPSAQSLPSHGRDDSPRRAGIHTPTPSILVVEDAYETAHLISLFVGPNATFEFASTASEARERLENQEFDLVLMDINLGFGESGLDVARAMRMFSHHKETPVIALTAYAMRGDKEQAIEAGCTDYLSKPFTRNQLIEKLAVWLSPELPH